MQDLNSLFPNKHKNYNPKIMKLFIQEADEYEFNDISKELLDKRRIGFDGTTIIPFLNSKCSFIFSAIESEDVLKYILKELKNSQEEDLNFRYVYQHKNGIGFDYLRLSKKGIKIYNFYIPKDHTLKKYLKCG